MIMSLMTNWIDNNVPHQQSKLETLWLFWFNLTENFDLNVKCIRLIVK